MEMSSNAAARFQLKNTAPAGKPSAPVSSRSNLPDVTKQSNNMDTVVQPYPTDKVLKTKLILPQSNTAVVKPQSISVSAMEQLFSGISSDVKEKSKSAPATVDTHGVTEAKACIVPNSDSNHLSVRVERSTSIGLNMMKPKVDNSRANTNITVPSPRTQDQTSHTVSFSPVTSPVRFNITGVDPSQHQTVQNYCQNLYQGVNLYANPVTHHLPTPQQFSFLQPLVSQQVPTVPYQLPSFPCLPYQTGYPASVTGQAPTWTYIPAAEHQYPLNLSLQNQTATPRVSQESVDLSKTISSNHMNQSQNEDSLNSQKSGQKRVESEKVSETQLKRQSTTPYSEMDATCPKKLEQEFPNEPQSISKVQSEPKSNFHTYVTKNNTGQTVLVPTAANSMAVDSVRAKVKSDLQALTDLTLGVGKDTGQESRIYLGAGMKDTNVLYKQQPDTSSSADNILKDPPILKAIPSPNWDKISEPTTSSNSPNTDIPVSPIPSERATNQTPHGRSGEIIYIDRNRKRLSLSSFPYSQEIRIPDGAFIKLKDDSVAMRNIGQTQGQSTSGSAGSSTVEVQSHITGKTVKELLQLQNLNSKSFSQTKQSHGMKPVISEESVFKGSKTDHSSSQITYTQNMAQQAVSMTKTEGPFDEKQDRQVGIDKVFVSEKVRLEDSNITVEIKQSDKLIADSKQVQTTQVKQRSKSDSTCASNVGQNNVVVGGVGQPFQRLRRRNMKSEGDFPAEVINSGEKSQGGSSENVNTNEMVHVLGTNKLVTVKVSKYPNLTMPCRPTYVSPEPATRGKKDGTVWQNNPLHIKVGKSPIIRSRPQESSCLSLEERQYLEQIQHFPRNQYANSSLAQLLMKKDGNTKTEAHRRWSTNDSENINPDTELVVGRRLNLYLPTKQERAFSCSDVAQGPSDMTKFDNDKSTNTLQDDDDDVFLETEPIYKFDAAVCNRRDKSGKHPVDMNESGDGKVQF